MTEILKIAILGSIADLENVIRIAEGRSEQMKDGKKLVGLCLTGMQETLHADFLFHLHHHLTRHGIKLIVLNSFVRPDSENSDRQGAASVYRLINYGLLDALILLGESLEGCDVLDEIIGKARANRVPVLLLNSEREGVNCLKRSFEEGYRGVIRHVVLEHGAVYVHYLGGKGEQDPREAERMNVLRETLRNEKVTLEADQIFLTGYRDESVLRYAARLRKTKQLPDAVFCVNDDIALRLSAALADEGIHVPGDTRVIGFNGLRASDYSIPRLTTCREDSRGLAVRAADLADRLIRGEKVPETSYYSYLTRIRESCGCTPRVNYDNFRSVCAEIFGTLRESDANGDYLLDEMEKMISVPDVNVMCSHARNWLPDGGKLCLNDDFLGRAIGNISTDQGRPFTEKMTVITSDIGPERSARMHLGDMVPDLTDWLSTDEAYVLCPIFTGNEVYGLFAMRTENIRGSVHLINRLSKALNFSFNCSVSRTRQRLMQQSIDEAALQDQMTDLPNRKGADLWFAHFEADPDNHRRRLTVSVFGLPEYHFILENYGLRDIEGSVSFVAGALKQAYPQARIIARTGETEFMVLNCYESGDEIGDREECCNREFYRALEQFNLHSGKAYQVEVNNGCIVVDAGWDTHLNTMIKFAGAEMHINRVKMNNEIPTVRDSAPLNEDYKAFDLLISKNLFYYCYQPIVHAESGEIFGYEALMRTPPYIGLSPSDVLNIAQNYGRLYDVEKATMFNVLAQIRESRDLFTDKRVFINTIPGHFLRDPDAEELVNTYIAEFPQVILELTERDTAEDSELDRLRGLTARFGKNYLAIDDYGTGHSNIVNLLRYVPCVIKIDHFLIHDIDRDKNKQMFVTNTVEFARLNGINTLAEGVETEEELRTVIRLGVNMLQGYYIGRPSTYPIDFIPDRIRDEIRGMFREANGLCQMSDV